MTHGFLDLLDEYEVNTEVGRVLYKGVFRSLLTDGFDDKEIDLVHCRVSSIPDLHLERFTKVEVNL